MKRGWYRIYSPWFVREYYGKANAMGWFDYYRRSGVAVTLEDRFGNIIRNVTMSEAAHTMAMIEGR